MARAPMPAPQMIETPAMRRSAMLAQMLEQQRQPTQITGGYGELAARLLGQGITQFASGRADKAAAQETEAQRQARMQGMAQILGLGGGAEPNAMADALSPPPAPSGPAPIAPVEGGPLPPVGQMPPPQQAPMAAPAAPQQEGIFGLADNERRLAESLIASGDEDGLAALVAAVRHRNVNPDIQVGPDGTTFNASDPRSLGQQFANRENVNNFIVDTNNPDNEGRYLPDLQPGEEPGYNQAGDIVGVRNMDGAIQALAGRERATADARNASEASYRGAIVGAEEAARAPYAIETVQGPAGQPIAMSREALLSGGGMAGQTPADAIREQGQATREVERGGNRVQAEGRMRAAATSAQNLTSAIERARGQIGGLSTGLIGAATGGIPGTPSRDLRATIETIKANVGFDYLQQMRELSPTGGALGQVAVQEMMALQAVLGNLDPNQSPEQLDRNLEQIQSIVEQGLRNRQAVFEEQYAIGSSPAAGARPRATNPQTGAVVEFDGQSWVPVR